MFCIKCLLDVLMKSNNGKRPMFIKTTEDSISCKQFEDNKHTSDWRYLYLHEMSSGNHGFSSFLISFEKTDIMQNNNTTFFYIIHSSPDYSLKAMGRFRNQNLLADNTWSTRYNLSKKDRYRNLSNHWTLVSLNFNVENFGDNLIYDEITDSPHSDMCFSIIVISHFIY